MYYVQIDDTETVIPENKLFHKLLQKFIANIFDM